MHCTGVIISGTYIQIPNLYYSSHQKQKADSHFTPALEIHFLKISIHLNPNHGQCHNAASGHPYKK